MIEFQLLLGLAVLSLLAAGIVLLHGGSEERQALGLQRLNSTLARLDAPGEFVPQAAAVAWVPPIVDSYLQRAGLTAEMKTYAWLAVPALVVFALAFLLFGLLPGLVGLFVVYPGLLGLFINWRIERFAGQVVALLPGFLDAISRILTVGCSLELAFRNASEETQEPLRGIVLLILLRTRAGVALEDAMSQVAEMYRIRELSFIASVFYLGVRYGGNAQVVLERICVTMRERQRGSKELHAMTAETRASAWILSALPVVVGLLTLASNPGYLLNMWHDDTGRQLLQAAAALQVAGMWLLFRMAKMK
ncbi:MAG: type II secretion system F family protein [Bacteroidota bacterium]